MFISPERSDRSYFPLRMSGEQRGQCVQTLSPKAWPSGSFQLAVVAYPCLEFWEGCHHTACAPWAHVRSSWRHLGSLSKWAPMQVSVEPTLPELLTTLSPYRITAETATWTVLPRRESQREVRRRGWLAVPLHLYHCPQNYMQSLPCGRLYTYKGKLP